MRFQIKPNSEIEALDIVDTESWTSLSEDRDNIVVASVYDDAIAESIVRFLEWLNPVRINPS